MMRRRSVRAVMATAMALVVLAAGCSSSADDSSTPATTVVAMPVGPPIENGAAVPTVQGPVTGGKGATVLGPGGFDLATVGYQQEEYFISGDATSYVADGALASDGNWTVSKGTTAPYTTRVVVRRPIDAADFDGTVVRRVAQRLGRARRLARLDLRPRRADPFRGRVGRRVGPDGRHRRWRQRLGAALALKNADPERYAALVPSGRRLLLRHVQPGRFRGLGRVGEAPRAPRARAGAGHRRVAVGLPALHLRERGGAHGRGLQRLPDPQPRRGRGPAGRRRADARPDPHPHRPRRAGAHLLERDRPGRRPPRLRPGPPARHRRLPQLGGAGHRPRRRLQPRHR